MKLFFETASQGQTCLWLCALGFLCALAVDTLRRTLLAHARALCDVLAPLLYGGALLSALLLFRGEGLRAYHGLALLAGTLLYACGLKRLSDWLLGRCASRLRRAQKKAQQANESIAKP